MLNQYDKKWCFNPRKKGLKELMENSYFTIHDSNIIEKEILYFYGGMIFGCERYEIPVCSGGLIVHDNIPGFEFEDIIREHQLDETVEETDAEKISRERKLLGKLYECQDELRGMLDNGEDDHHYLYFCDLIERLEKYLQDQGELM